MTDQTTTDRWRTALEQIADGLRPCTKCEKVHQPRKSPPSCITDWSDPDDGHAYAAHHPSTIAKRALDG